MRAYLNRKGNSNVKCYEIGNTYIDVCFFGTPRRIDIPTPLRDEIMLKK